MYYPVGWQKVLNVDTTCDGEECNILLVQANHEREFFFILTTKSIHIWQSRPQVEIVSHRRNKQSIESIGLNRTAVWKIDSSVIVVATEKDQLLFYQVRRRSSPTSAFLLQSYSESETIYRLRFSPNDLKNVLGNDSNRAKLSLKDDSDSVPALTIYSFGKLDLSSIGVSCLMSAEEELVIGAKNGEIYGIHWNGNVDDKFPWSLCKDAATEQHQQPPEYVIDLKFSSILSGFGLIYSTGRVGFMPIRRLPDQKLLEDSIQSTLSNDETNNNYTTTLPSPKTQQQQNELRKTNISYLPDVDDAVCAEVNHKYKLLAIGLKSSVVIVCNIADHNSSFIVNHKLDIGKSKFPYDESCIGPVRCMSYSPDNFALVVCWKGGEFALWSVFGTLLFCSQQWRSEILDDIVLGSYNQIKVSSLSWGHQGHNLWMSLEGNDHSIASDERSENNIIPSSSNKPVANSNQKENLTESDQSGQMTNSLDLAFASNVNSEVVILSVAHSSLSNSPHLTCSTDTILFISEERIYLGPSVPNTADFDNWLVIDIPQSYLSSNYPIRYLSCDRDGKNVAIAGRMGFAIHSLELGTWNLFKKKSHENEFSVCGDIIWWRNYIILSCFSSQNDSFEIRAYLTEVPLSNDYSISTTVPIEIIKISLFENRILTLYNDGSLGMFILNLRPRPPFKGKPKRPLPASITSRVGVGSGDDSTGSGGSSRSVRSDSVSSSIQRAPVTYREVYLQISPIENMVISNLQANAYCISSIALTRLHFKNERSDDSILLNSCGKLFLLERELTGKASMVANRIGDSDTVDNPTTVDDRSSTTTTPTSDNGTQSRGGSLAGDLAQLSLESNKSSASSSSIDLPADTKIQSAKRLSESMHLASASLRNRTDETTQQVTFKAVSVIASEVEHFWVSPEISEAGPMSYFKRSLWLSCGGNTTRPRLQVWLPLLNDPIDPPNDLYVPDRIMVPIKCDIYPLTIRSSSSDSMDPDDAIVLGAEPSTMNFSDCRLFRQFPYCTLKRQCRVFLHRILRELLLNQHLGYYARKIAQSCHELPYFGHCFELLLHEVLEEEATSPEPLPDPMLPQVVRFIRGFNSVYLETVVHCARKSELSMWSHLFDERAVGSPHRLFEECLRKGRLDTAASCLIILQSLDQRSNLVVCASRKLRDLIKDDQDYQYLAPELESFLTRAEIGGVSCSASNSNSPEMVSTRISPTSPQSKQ